MDFLIIITMCLIGAIIGWITNLIAIKLLFKPYEPFRIPIVNFDIHGLIPKRKGEIAKSIGNIVEQELLSVNDILIHMLESDKKVALLAIIKFKIKETIQKKIPSIIPSGFIGLILNYIDEIIEQEGEKVISEIMQNIVQDAGSMINISKIVEDKVNEFSMEKLEDVVLQIAKKELKHIEILGGILGGIIGIIQGLIVMLLQ
ncbi:DUF445 family protein [Serpentinicella alkaliphila]|uniref:Uncharacterized protein DUF445 n=1 Tax=Serpentinicella alkaliphila TaxID=1734049 RepID=A0A4R2TKQ0_9FIRM|nr:DUF445 family protein [Serpentinicella alkaliphila]QUH24438.1 DUF445 family protein [Serpentinicella alkaliphila]TCQ04168.1 uncharacterized protein DUF445 [Serpentinicella alkaliphila]